MRFALVHTRAIDQARRSGITRTRALRPRLAHGDRRSLGVTAPSGTGGPAPRESWAGMEAPPRHKRTRRALLGAKADEIADHKAEPDDENQGGGDIILH